MPVPSRLGFVEVVATTFCLALTRVSSTSTKRGEVDRGGSLELEVAECMVVGELGCIALHASHPSRALLLYPCQRCPKCLWGLYASPPPVAMAVVGLFWLFSCVFLFFEKRAARTLHKKVHAVYKKHFFVIFSVYDLCFFRWKHMLSSFLQGELMEHFQPKIMQGYSCTVSGRSHDLENVNTQIRLKRNKHLRKPCYFRRPSPSSVNPANSPDSEGAVLK